METARLLQKEKHQKRSGIHHKKRKPGEPQQHLDRNEKSCRKSIPAQPTVEKVNYILDFPLPAPYNKPIFFIKSKLQNILT
jgi:hypothetical protein